MSNQQTPERHDPVAEAELNASGFYQCPTCALIWFGGNNTKQCPNGHPRQQHVEVLCRDCDEYVPVSRFAAHLTSDFHLCATR